MPVARAGLVRFREPGLALGGLAAVDAGTGHPFAAEGDVAERSLGFGLDRRLALAAAAPPGDDEARTALHRALELVVGRCARRVVLAELERALQQRLLNLVEEIRDSGA